ncbi:MAG: GGDEF domain-containing protein [Acholeplasmataceae bacterium]|nr:MAG: GGDEF domain-containing protein [Acholeplasmataceae bacterium]
MRLADILKLPKEPHSLSIIKDYLEQPLGHVDYQAAFSHYFDIGIALGLEDMVFHEGERVIKELENQAVTDHQEKMLKHVITAAIKLEKYDAAKVYIEQRKQLLPVLKQYLGVLDEIAYKKALNLPYEDDVQKVLKDVIPDPVKIICLEELYAIHKHEDQPEKALESLYKLFELDQQHKYNNDELMLLLKLKRFEEASEKALVALKEHPDNAWAVQTLLAAYVATGEHHKAMTLEANHEDLIDKQDDVLRTAFYEQAIALYKKLDNKLSLDAYTRKLKSLQRTTDKKAKTTATEQKEVVVVEAPAKKTMSRGHVLEHLDLANDLIVFSHQIDEKLPLRDYLRTFFMHLEGKIKTKDIAVYLHQMMPNFFHYKKERLYDKTLGSAQLEDTVLAKVLESHEDIFEETQTMRWPKNVITQKDYDDDVKFVYAFPIGDAGAVLFHFETIIKDPGDHYDLLRLVANILYAHLLDEKKTSRFKRENRTYQGILDSPLFAFREMSEARSTYNEAAQQLFHIDRHHHLELFLRDVSYEYVHAYKDAIQKLFAKPGETKELLYVYQGKHIVEKMVSIRIGEDIHIMSLFSDQSETVEATKELVEQATVDPETGLANMHALHEAFEDHLTDKASLLLVELDQQLKHIYGSDKMVHYFKEFAQVTKKFFQAGVTYRFDFNQLLVILPFNDIRTVTKLVKDYFRYLEGYTSKILPYEKYRGNMGIVRFPVVTIDKNRDKLFRYLDIALDKAKRDREEHFVFFVYRDYEDELFEQQVIDHLNLAIETKSLSLVFNQITDIKKNRVWQYESELSLPNLTIDSKYLMAIAGKRNRLVDLERFHIERVCTFLVALEKETERLIKLTIPISKETFLEPTFNAYVSGLFKQYGIPYEFIRFKFDMDIRASHYATQIQELIDHGISLDTTSLDMALAYPFHALHVEHKKATVKWHSYLSKVKELLDGFNMALIVRGVKTKDQKESLERLGIQYMEGTLYKQLPGAVLTEKIKESL